MKKILSLSVFLLISINSYSQCYCYFEKTIEKNDNYYKAVSNVEFAGGNDYLRDCPEADFRWQAHDELKYQFSSYDVGVNENHDSHCYKTRNEADASRRDVLAKNKDAVITFHIEYTPKQEKKIRSSSSKESRSNTTSSSQQEIVAQNYRIMAQRQAEWERQEAARKQWLFENDPWEYARQEGYDVYQALYVVQKSREYNHNKQIEANNKAKKIQLEKENKIKKLQLEKDRKAWEKIKNSNSINKYELYLKNFPKGVYEKQAEHKIWRIEKEQREHERKILQDEIDSRINFFVKSIKSRSTKSEVVNKLISNMVSIDGRMYGGKFIDDFQINKYEVTISDWVIIMGDVPKKLEAENLLIYI